MQHITSISFILIFLFPFSLFAQNLSGTLIVKKTNESIPYASVQIGNNYGVVTNNEGKFQINIDHFSNQDSLYFSSLGYKGKRIAIKDFQQEMKIYLTEGVNQLDNVYLVDSDTDVNKIIEKAKNNIYKNYSLDSINSI